MNAKLDLAWNNYAGSAGKHDLSKNGTSLGVATAAGAAVFALQPHTEATIIYHGTPSVAANIVNTGAASDRVGVDLNGDAVNDFNPHVLFNNGGPFGIAGFGAGFPFNAGPNQVLAVAAGSFVGLRKLASGSNIANLATGNWGTGGELAAINPAGNQFVGTWNNGEVAFAGVRLFDSPTNYRYGWVRLRWNDTDAVNPYPNQITAIDWAYETDLNTPIAAGAMPVPEPSSVGLLGLAAAGTALARWRRRKSA